MDNTYEREQSKYKKLREVHAPGFNPNVDWTVTRDAFSCGMKAGDTLLDAGSGMGNIAKWFRDKGMSVTEVDIAPVHDRVIEAALWDMSHIEKHDWVFCGDVLEHIPPEYVSQSLSELHRLATKGIYLSICCRPDNKGDIIGETLHLTVKPYGWWINQVVGWPNLSVKLYQDNVLICSTFSS